MDLIESLRSGKMAAVRAAVKASPAQAKNARAIGVAAGLGFLEAIEFLVKHGADLNAIHRGYRPLHALIQEKPHGDQQATGERLACLRWMLEHGANPELTGAWPPARALLVATWVGEEQYVDALLDGGAKPNGFVAAALGDIDEVSSALQSDPSFAHARDEGGLTALQCCCASRMKAYDERLAVATLLLENGADPNARTKSWSHEVDTAYFAASANNKQIFELLLRNGAGANAALPSTLWRKEMDLAEIAMDHGAHPDQALCENRPVLNELVRWGQVTPVLWLLSKGANPNIPDERGWTAVHQAASRGNEKMLKAILDAGGDLSRKDKQGYTPLVIARTSTPRPKILAMLTPRATN